MEHHELSSSQQNGIETWISQRRPTAGAPRPGGCQGLNHGGHYLCGAKKHKAVPGAGFKGAKGEYDWERKHFVFDASLEPAAWFGRPRIGPKVLWFDP